MLFVVNGKQLRYFTYSPYFYRSNLDSELICPNTQFSHLSFIAVYWWSFDFKFWILRKVCRHEVVRQRLLRRGFSPNPHSLSVVGAGESPMSDCVRVASRRELPGGLPEGCGGFLRTLTRSRLRAYKAASRREPQSFSRRILDFELTSQTFLGASEFWILD